MLNLSNINDVPPSQKRQERLKRLYQVATTSPTEQVNPNTANIDKASIKEQLTLINQQDASVTDAVNKAIPQLSPLVEAIIQHFQHYPDTARLIYVGAGTSGRLGVLDAVECVPTFGIEPGIVIGIIAGGENALTQAVEGAEDSAQLAITDLDALTLTPADTVIGISASGGAAYVTKALQAAKQAGCLTGAITNNPKAKLLGIAQHDVILHTGPEVITGSTRMKAGTAQKLVLNMLSTTVMMNLGHTYGNVMIDVKPTNEKLIDRAIRLTSALADTSMEMAKSTLEQTDFKVKPAVVMLINQWDRPMAEQKLTETSGQLWPLID